MNSYRASNASWGAAPGCYQCVLVVRLLIITSVLTLYGKCCFAEADNPAQPSFNASVVQGLITHDFGTVAGGANAPDLDFSVFNLAAPSGVTSAMSLSGTSSLGDSSKIILSPSSFSGLAPGDSAAFTLSLDTTTPGEFEVSYLLAFSSDQLPDEPDTLLAIAAFATILTPGDYNTDGTVDSIDYAVWRAAYGSSGGQADGNHDGVVDAADYSVWRNHLEAPINNAALLSAAPEPLTLLLYGAAAICFTAVRGGRAT